MKWQHNEDKSLNITQNIITVYFSIDKFLKYQLYTTFITLSSKYQVSFSQQDFIDVYNFTSSRKEKGKGQVFFIHLINMVFGIFRNML